VIRRKCDPALQVGGDTRVVVATDDGRIWQEAEGFGAEVVMTSSGLCRFVAILILRLHIHNGGPLYWGRIRSWLGS
jgi:hypothetical protein